MLLSLLRVFLRIVICVVYIRRRRRWGLTVSAIWALRFCASGFRPQKLFAEVDKKLPVEKSCSISRASFSPSSACLGIWCYYDVYPGCKCKFMIGRARALAACSLTNQDLGSNRKKLAQAQGIHDSATPNQVMLRKAIGDKKTVLKSCKQQDFLVSVPLAP
jgi:hypothetical protein